MQKCTWALGQEEPADHSQPFGKRRVIRKIGRLFLRAAEPGEQGLPPSSRATRGPLGIAIKWS